ncbi:ly6/PLAUR domain-containing protein 6-like isoform X1 [Lethenteron reissneri]|uniref:ly6/PLAUR domain-containing protein 6-like isoform X1 n=1 Tax=Lethenteron reissneri TaxID=7753 RepID=UPI002AB7C78C|nr:ly6/PLAUR domain-containing protein 6-like isoform X1 [Lethenteron reissneri]
MWVGARVGLHRVWVAGRVGGRAGVWGNKGDGKETNKVVGKHTIIKAMGAWNSRRGVEVNQAVRLNTAKAASRATGFQGGQTEFHRRKNSRRRIHSLPPQRLSTARDTLTGLLSVQTFNYETAHSLIYPVPPATPYPGAFKCFTCEDAKDNYECNRWAPDTYCPRESRYCYTYHHMRSGGSSVSVTKRCAALEQCLGTGCRDGPLAGEQECVTCCEGSICNLPVPLNASDSVFATVLPLSAARSGTRGALPPGRLAVLGLLAGVTALGV